MAERRNIPSFSGGSRTSTTSPRLTSSMKRLTDKRYRNEIMIFMRSDEPNPQSGPLWKREDYKSSTSALMCLQQELRGQDSTTHWTLPFNKIWSGSARTGRRTSRHRLHPLLRHGHKKNSTWWNSQHWENSQQWREWQPEEWQDQRWLEKW